MSKASWMVMSFTASVTRPPTFFPGTTLKSPCSERNLSTARMSICRRSSEILLASPGRDAGFSGPASLGDSDRKSTRLNSSHGYISYAVFCLKKKKTQTHHLSPRQPATLNTLTPASPSPARSWLYTLAAQAAAPPTACVCRTLDHHAEQTRPR